MHDSNHPYSPGVTPERSTYEEPPQGQNEEAQSQQANGSKPRPEEPAKGGAASDQAHADDAPAKGSVSAHPEPASSEPHLPEDVAAAADAAMEAATSASADAPAPAAPDQPGAPPQREQPRPARAPGGAAAPPAIRGPRVVQAGREHRTGVVVSVGPEDLFVEFGPKELGVAKRVQWPDDQLPKVGEQLEVVVDRYEPNEQLFLCSRPGAIQKAEWELLEVGQTVEVRVTGTNKGGLECEVAGHRAFMPASRVDTRRIEDLSIFVGEKIPARVTQVDRAGKGNIVLSRREIVKEQEKESKQALKESLKEGQTIEGPVRKIMDFGAFVEIAPGVDGLVHVSDLSHDRVRNVQDVVKEGQTVKAKVMKIDWAKNRISLSMKETQADPFQTAADELTPEEIVTGRVTKLLDYGAFVEIAAGVEGLVHISEISWKRIPSPSAAISEGETVKVKILEVDPERRRIALSIKQTTDAPANMRDKEGKRSEEEIRKETPALRRMREKAKQRERDAGLKSGLGDVGGVGLGELGELGDLKLG